MGDIGIGPKVYEAFYVLFPKEVIQFIIMEPADTSSTEIYYSKLPMNLKIETTRRILELLHEQIYDHGMYCVDIKPGNFVVTYKNYFDVKMIDFGVDFCSFSDEPENLGKMYKSLGKVPGFSKKDLFFVIMMIQFILFISKFPQGRELVEPFFQGNYLELFTLFLKGDAMKVLNDVKHYDSFLTYYYYNQVTEDKNGSFSQNILNLLEHFVYDDQIL